MNIENKHKSKLSIVILVIMIISVLGYVGMTSFGLGVGIKDLLTIKNNPDASLTGLGFVIVMVIIGTIVYGVVTVLAALNLILSIINKNNKHRKFSIIINSIGIVLPYLTEYLLLAIIGPMF